MSERFVYRGGQRKVESVVKRSKQAGGLYDSWINPEFAFLKVKEGEMEVRIVGAVFKKNEDAEAQAYMDKWGDGWEIAVYLHNNIGPDSGTYLCLDKMLGKPCPICELRASGRLEDEEADKLKPSWRAVCWAVDKDSTKAGPQVWALPITLFREINNRSVDKRSNTPILIDDPENGFNVIFDRQGTGLKTKYSGVEVSRDPTPLHEKEAVQERWLEYIHDNPLPTVLQYYEYDHIKKVVEGRVARKRSDDDEDDAPRSTRRGLRDKGEDAAPTRRRLAREDDSEDEAPRSRRAAPAEERPSRRAREEEDTDEAPRSRRRQEPEDPEPAPRSTRRAAEEPEDPPSSRRGSERRVEEEPPEDEERSTRRAKSNGDGEPEERPARRRLAEPEGDDKAKDKDARDEKEDAEEDLPAAASTARRRISELKTRRSAD